MKRFLKITGTILLALCLILCGFLTYLTVTEYRPEDRSVAETEILEEEYEKENYVIAGGDFNQVFPDSLTIYPIKNPELWEPGVLQKEYLPAGWSFAYDTSTPSCRLLNQPYAPNSKDT